MWCRSVQRQMVPYVDGRLRGRRYAAVAEHLERCRPCSAAADGLREINALLDREREAPVPPELEREVMRRIRDVEAESPTPGLVKWLVPVTAGVCAVGMALYIGGDRLEPEETAGRGETRVVARAPSPIESTASATSAGRDAMEVAPAGPEVAALRDEPEVQGAAAPVETSTRGQVLAEISRDLPPELSGALDLFVDYPIIWELEKFEHYETIWASSAGESGPATRGG